MINGIVHSDIRPDVKIYLDNRPGSERSENISVLDIINQILEDFPEDHGNIYIYNWREAPDGSFSSFPDYHYPYHHGRIPSIRWEHFKMHFAEYRVYMVKRIEYSDSADFKITADKF